MVLLLDVLNGLSHVMVPGGVQIKFGDAWAISGGGAVFDLLVP
jgi:hypothetical protein